MNERDMPISGHLAELRLRALLGLALLLPCVAAGVYFSGDMLRWVFLPAVELGFSPRLFQLGDALSLRLRVGGLAGLAASAPWLAWQAYAFLRSGLTAGEARLLRRACLLFGAGFTAGAAAYTLLATRPLVAWLCAMEGGAILLDAQKVFSLWEGTTFFAGTLGGAIIATPAAVVYLRKRRRRE